MSLSHEEIDELIKATSEEPEEPEAAELIKATSEEPEAAADSDATSPASTVVAEYSFEELGPDGLNYDLVKQGDHEGLFLQDLETPNLMFYAIRNKNSEGADYESAAFDKIMEAAASEEGQGHSGPVNLGAFKGFDVRERHDLKVNCLFRGINIWPVVQRLAEQEEAGDLDKEMAYHYEQIELLRAKKRKAQEGSGVDRVSRVSQSVEQGRKDAKERERIRCDQRYSNWISEDDAKFAAKFDEAEQELREEHYRADGDTAWGEAIEKWVLKNKEVWRTSNVKELCKAYNPEEAHTYQEVEHDDD